jgi:hypothetical protein
MKVASLEAENKDLQEYNQKLIQFVADRNEALKEKDRDISHLCTVLQTVHDMVPHGAGIHETIRVTIAKYEKEPGQSKETPAPAKKEGRKNEQGFHH